jgi:hypothetical protein
MARLDLSWLETILEAHLTPAHPGLRTSAVPTMAVNKTMNNVGHRPIVSPTWIKRPISIKGTAIKAINNRILALQFICVLVDLNHLLPYIGIKIEHFYSSWGNRSQ